MAKTRTTSKDDHHKGAMSPSNSMVGEEATNSEGVVQTVNAMMLIRKCLEMILLAFK